MKDVSLDDLIKQDKEKRKKMQANKKKPLGVVLSNMQKKGGPRFQRNNQKKPFQKQDTRGPVKRFNRAQNGRVKGPSDRRRIIRTRKDDKP